jgi:hypothetical protein
MGRARFGRLGVKLATPLLKLDPELGRSKTGRFKVEARRREVLAEDVEQALSRL